MTDAQPPTRPLAGRRWWLWLALVCGVGLAVRVAHALLVDDAALLQGDAYQYHEGAKLLADGEGFVSADPYGPGGEQTAQHPPLYTVALAVPSLLGLRSTVAHQLWSCGLGTASVAVVGLAGRRLAGPAVGLIAAGLLAVYPNAWIFDGLLAAETLSLLTAGLTVLAAYRLLERRSVRTAAELGGACALAALTRAEALLLVPLLAVGFVLVLRQAGLRRRLGLALVSTATAAALIGPWVAFNLGRFERPVLGTSTGFELALVQGNCHQVYFGEAIGYYSVGCIPTLPSPAGDETEQGRQYRRVAFAYMEANWPRIPFVLFARQGRAWGFYRPLEQLRIEDYVQARDRPIGAVGLAMYYGLVAAAVPGALALRREGRGQYARPLAALVATVVAAVALAWGESRYRVSAEPALVLLAAVGVHDVWRRRPWRADSTPPAEGAVPA